MWWLLWRFGNGATRFLVLLSVFIYSCMTGFCEFGLPYYHRTTLYRTTLYTPGGFHFG